MKIGILTFYWSKDNYGQLLQAFALQKFLKNKGHEAFLIRYNFESKIKQNPLWKRCYKALHPIKLYNFLKRRMTRKKIQAERLQHDRHFDDFRKNYFSFSANEYYSFNELKQNPPEADFYIVGSDQVWNPNCAGGMDAPWFENILKAYFLGFGNPQTKKLSYAASWGIKELNPKIAHKIQPLLKEFSYVSVRENSGIALCEQCGFKNAEWVIDPTMLLKAKDYKDLYTSENFPKQDKPFLLLYMLANTCDFDIKKAFDFAKQKNLEVVYVTGNGVLDTNKKTFATIPEWLYLVDNAKYVITNSFHCGVFSTIFNTKYAIVPLSGNVGGMNARFDSLFERAGIESRYLDSDFKILEKEFAAKEFEVSAKFLTEIGI